MTLNEFRDKCHAMARKKGWHDGDHKTTALEYHALIISEVAEAIEQVREGKSWMYFVESKAGNKDSSHQKPEGEAVELADAMIRIADYFGLKGWDLEGIIQIKMSFNSTRSYRHGGKVI